MNKRILISRIDSIGDVILTLPMCGLIKSVYPQAIIAFLGTDYTQPIIQRCRFVDEFYNWHGFREHPDSLNRIKADVIIHAFPQKLLGIAAKKAGIKLRIGTTHRLHHWFTCNRLVNLGRKNSNLNEAQLNLRLLRPLGIKKMLTLVEIPSYYGWQASKHIPKKVEKFLAKDKFNLILHLKSQGNAMEWPPDKFLDLAHRLAPDYYSILISGTESDKVQIENELPAIFKLPHVVNIAGELSLDEFIDLVQFADGLVSSSTGPLHIAAASGIHTLGLYPDIRPKHAIRWGPVGIRAEWISEQGSDSRDIYLNQIEPKEVYMRILSWDKIHSDRI